VVTTLQASLVLVGLLCAVATRPVQAQNVQGAQSSQGLQSTQGAQSAQSAKTEDSAMDRAQRQADNPLRMILEAGKIRRRGEPDTPDTPRPAAKATATTPSVPVAASRQAAPSVASTTVAFASPAATPGATAAPAPNLVAANPGPTVMSILAPPALSMTAVPALARTEPASNGVANTLNALTTPRLTSEQAAPKLVSMVEPSLSQRFFDDAGRRVEVVMDLALRSDGTVAEVRFVPPVPRGAQRAVQSAVEQWRFSPLAQPTVHRVVAVLKAPDN
jgi:hypothetical protein